MPERKYHSDGSYDEKVGNHSHHFDRTGHRQGWTDHGPSKDYDHDEHGHQTSSREREER